MVDWKGGTAGGVLVLHLRIRWPSLKIRFEKGVQDWALLDSSLLLIQPVWFLSLPASRGFPLLAHNALPFSELEKPIGSNVLISHVVGLITAMGEMLLQWLHVWWLNILPFFGTWLEKGIHVHRKWSIFFSLHIFKGESRGSTRECKLILLYGNAANLCQPAS